LLSLITCSRFSDIEDALKINLRETVGVKYELIVVNNSNGQKSIFEAYNEGIEKSTGDFLVFLHDDLRFKTINWGAIIEEIFDGNPQMGLLGIAGSKIKTRMPSPWWTNPIHIRIVQHHKDGKQSEEKNIGFKDKELVEVAVLDGVLMVMRRDEKIRFNKYLKGFHNYDLDLSLEHHKLGKGVYTTNRILIEHFSGGTVDEKWYKSTSKFHKIRANELPVVIDNSLTKEELWRKEFSTGASFVLGLLEYGLRKEAIFWWFKLFQMKTTAKFHLRFFTKLIKGII
jgi:glycosyltransferase involved in cell wall biosynthesis